MLSYFPHAAKILGYLNEERWFDYKIILFLYIMTHWHSIQKTFWKKNVCDTILDVAEGIRESIHFPRILVRNLKW